MLLAEEVANEKAEKEIRGQAQQQVVFIVYTQAILLVRL